MNKLIKLITNSVFVYLNAAPVFIGVLSIFARDVKINGHEATSLQVFIVGYMVGVLVEGLAIMLLALIHDIRGPKG